jgi:hypothetical protein
MGDEKLRPALWNTMTRAVGSSRRDRRMLRISPIALTGEVAEDSVVV